MEATLERAELVDRAAELVPLLRANAPRAAHERRPPRENLEALRDAGLLHLLRPARFGGHEADMRTKDAVVAEIARGCGSTAWVALIYNDADYLLARFPDELQELVFADPDTRATATLIPKGRAERRGDGYVVSGRWPFNTGCMDAEWVMQPTFCDGVPVQVLLPYSDVVIEDDWMVSGMSGTASNTVRADEVFVPEDRVVRQVDVVGETHLSDRNADTPLYRIPLILELLTGGPAPFTGMSATAVELSLAQLAEERPIAYTGYAARRDAAITHHQMAEASLLIESAGHHAASAAGLVDARIADGEPFRPEDKARVWGLVSYATKLHAQAAEILRAAAGAGCIRVDSPLNLVLRDIQALAAHAAMMPATGIEHYGRSLCGLPPATPLLA
ncbi:acyl-CoA dehydrogenase family protein [Actinokineospora fastidiosa]|uniref:Acyl-CoA dehydrogenase n=1 Tax=Actinokineospora fastidiosa TaxID=1816 RepID=A0A918G6L1_9PSEU|nr:acyl-CoA dehydrogenase family protein [Actinokineospora fastidiosa]GGS21940.1 acyl-CoA dehydrogenase [Actinokineospora fastidiosa]